ncbi:MAG: TolC family outer membrane protein [Methyloprofundus sp.]|nr:TolC family outer membrane protein [Methyloprofundus sp.]MBW6453871.1 TolC family outer membrane protein [Methyloprofundus sp.]
MKKTTLSFILLFSGTLQAQNLLETYQLALQNDPVLRQSLANKSAVNELKDQSIARLLPSVNFNAASNYLWQNQKNPFNQSPAGGAFGFTARNNHWESRFGLNLVQPIFHWDQWVQLSQSDKQIAQAEASYRAEQQKLIVKTTQAYFAVLAAQDDLIFINSEKKSIARQLEQAQQRFDVGLIAITDVYEAQAGYDQVRSEEIAALNAVENSKEALKEIIGSTLTELSSLGETLPLPQPEPAEIEQWNNTALIQNLQLLVAKTESEIIKDTIELQRSGHYPQIDFVGNFGMNDSSGTNWARGDTQSVGLQINVPIFEGGAVTSRTREAEYRYIQAKENVIATERAVTKTVKDAYRGVMASISRVEALKAAVKSGDSALEATEAGFDVGTRTMVDVLTATRNLKRAKSDYAKARYDYLINGIILKNAASSLTVEDLVAINRYLK